MERAGRTWAGRCASSMDPGVLSTRLAQVRQTGAGSAGRRPSESWPEAAKAPKAMWDRHRWAKCPRYLFWTGQVTASAKGELRAPDDLPERCADRGFGAPTPPMTRRSVSSSESRPRALGVATERTLATTGCPDPDSKREWTNSWRRGGRSSEVSGGAGTGPTCGRRRGRPRANSGPGAAITLDTLIGPRSYGRLSTSTNGLDLTPPPSGGTANVFPFLLGES